MIEKRSLYILKLIINNPNITIQEIQLKSNLTRRQVDYSIESINNWLIANGYSVIDKQIGGKFSFDNNVKAIIKELLKGNVDYIFNEEERQKIIFFYLYLQYEEISLYNFVDILKVSRGTIAEDLKKLNRDLEPLGIEVKYSRQRGYRLIGEESKILYAMMYSIVEIVSFEEALYITQAFIQNKDFKLLYQFKKDLSDELLNEGLFISGNNIKIISYIFIFYFIRGKRTPIANKNKLSTKLIDTDEYKVAELTLKNHKDVNEQTIEFLTSLLLAYSTKKVTDSSAEDLMIDQLIIGVLDRLKKTYAIALKDKQTIFEQLRAHIRPAIFRLYFNYPMVNPLKKQIINKYGAIFTLIEDLFMQSELEIMNSMSEDDIAYLTIHFAPFLIETQTNELAKIKGVVVCPSGIGVSVLLRKELSELFTEVIFLESISIGELEELSDEVDVVFSTVLVDTEKPLFLVDPLMNNIEKVSLVKNFNKRFSNLSIKEDINIQTLLNTIEKYADIKDEAELIKELTYLLSGQTNYFEIRKEQPMLSEITSPQLVQLNVDATDWKDAIQKSAQPMVEMEKITNEYIQAMIKSAEENGPYIVITEHVALPHARPEDGVLETSIGIATLKEPIIFGHELHDPVKYIFCLSTIDNSSHLRALAELVELLSDDKFYERLDQATDPQEIIAYIQEKEEVE